MRKMDLFQNVQPTTRPMPDRRSAPLADAVHGEHGRTRKRRRKERAGGVRQVMLGEQHRTRPDLRSRQFTEMPAQAALLKKLVLTPDGHRHPERAKAARHGRQVRFDQPLELQQRLVVEHDVIDVPHSATGFAQAIGDGVCRKRGVVLAPGEPLFLSSRDDASIDHQRRRAVVVERRNAENPHEGSRLRTACR